MPDRHSIPDRPSATQRPTSSSQSSPAAAATVTPSPPSLMLTPLVTTCSTVPGKPSSATTRLLPPPRTSTGSPASVRGAHRGDDLVVAAGLDEPRGRAAEPQRRVPGEHHLLPHDLPAHRHVLLALPAGRAGILARHHRTSLSRYRGARTGGEQARLAYRDRIGLLEMLLKGPGGRARGPAAHADQADGRVRRRGLQRGVPGPRGRSRGPRIRPSARRRGPRRQARGCWPGCASRARCAA